MGSSLVPRQKCGMAGRVTIPTILAEPESDEIPHKPNAPSALERALPGLGFFMGGSLLLSLAVAISFTMYKPVKKTGR